MKPSKGSLIQAKKIYKYIVGNDYHSYPTSDIEELATYLDNIKKQAQRKFKNEQKSKA